MKRIILVLLVVGLITAPSYAGTLKLAWDDTNNPPAEGFKVYQDDVKVGDVAVKEWTTGELVVGTTYCWTITAYRGTASSLPSAKLCVVYQDQQVIVLPMPPTDITIRFAQ